MRLHPGKQRLPVRPAAPLSVLEYPVRRLIMPHQRMSAQLHAMLAGERRNPVGFLERIRIFLRMNAPEFHLVLRRQAVIVLHQQIHAG